MTLDRDALPQLSGDLFLTDAGVETDLIFNHGIEIRNGVLSDAPWARRIRGVRANASRKSHAELDASTVLDPGNPQELAGQYRQLAQRMPWLNVFGGCCGSDLRHVTEIAQALPVTPVGGQRSA